MPYPRWVTPLTLAALTVAGAATPAAGKQAPSRVTGSMHATWVQEQGALTGDGEGFRRDVALRWKPVAVARTFGQAYAWIQGRQTRYSGYALEFDWGLLIRATVDVERFTETRRARCRDGSFAELTTTVASVVSPQVLLKTSDTRLDLPRRQGTLDIRLPNDHVATGEPLVNTFLAPGTVRLAYSGTICPESGGAVAPGPLDLPEEQDLGTFLGSEPLNGIVQDNADLPVTVARDGTLTVKVQRRHELSGSDEGVRIAGSFDADLRITGPTTDRSAQCTLPTAAVMRGARSLASVQRLLRRHGFPRAPLGRPRKARDAERGARFALNAPDGSRAPCGGTLGTARRPVLVSIQRT